MNNDPNKLTLEKLEIHKRLVSVEAFIEQGQEQRAQINDTLTRINLRCTNIELKLDGDIRSNIKNERDGLIRRLEELESKDQLSEKIKGNFIKMAVGSITLALGTFVLWLCKLIWGAIGK